MLMVGSRSFSLGTSIQFISMAPGSPGEHGVSRSSTILPLFMGHSPRTWKQTKETWNSKRQQEDLDKKQMHMMLKFHFLRDIQKSRKQQRYWQSTKQRQTDRQATPRRARQDQYTLHRHTERHRKADTQNKADTQPNTYSFEVRGTLHFPDRLHQRIAHHNADIRTRESATAQKHTTV